MKRRTFNRSLGAALLPAFSVPAVRAQSWNVDTVKFIVPFAPGGGIDIAARITAERLGKRVGKTFVVENKPGAGTIIGTQAVASAAADGRTFLFGTNNLTINPSLYRKLPYDSRSLVPVSLVALHPLLLLVHPGLGVATVQELVALAKSRSGKLSYASVGSGSPQHLQMEIFMRSMGIEMVHVPYQGSAPAVTDLLTGTVHAMFNGVSPTLQHVRAGKLKALGTDTAARVAVLPDVPSLAEAGVPTFRTISWSGIFAPAATPASITHLLSSAVTEMLREPEARAQLEALGLQPSGLTGSALAAHLSAEQVAWADAVRQTGARAD